MKSEIDRDWFCSCLKNPNECEFMCFIGAKKACHHVRRKYPTPEQFREEYGHEYPDDGAIYFVKGTLDICNDREQQTATYTWTIRSYTEALLLKDYSPMLAGSIVCACTPWAKPPDDWRP